MTRLNLWLAVGLSLASSVALAESQADIANRENDEGKELMYASKYPDASAKFRDAVARVPEPKYFLNLCASLYQEGKFGEALTACNSAQMNSPDAAVKDKVDKLAQRIRDDAKSQGLDLQPVGGGAAGDIGPVGGQPTGGQPTGADPTGGQPTGGQPTGGQPTGGQPTGGQPTGGQPTAGGAAVQYRPVVGRPPEVALFRAQQPNHNYTWSLGIDLFGGGAKFQGQIPNGGGDAFGSVSSGFRIKSDVILNRAQRFGAQGWISLTHVTDNGMSASALGSLDILDVGVGLYKHICVPGISRLCVTPLLGASLAFMDPNQNVDEDGMQTFDYLALGVRGEINASFAFGRRQEHVLSVMFDVNVYTAAFSDPTDGSPPRDQVGLDQGGAVAYVGIGYTYRFNTPLGRAAFITLE